MITLIVAWDEKMGIGKDGTIPWHVREDFYWFKTITMGGVVVMGRKTFESLPQPLPGRHNVVLSTNPEYTTPYSQDRVLVINKAKLISDLPLGDYFIIGGAEIYRQFLPVANRLIVTRVEGNYDTDTRFPEVNWGEWLDMWSARSSESGCTYTIYERIKGKA